MTTRSWQSKHLPVASLFLDSRNPRLGRETAARTQREIIQYLFEHDKALDVAESIVTRGYFPNEPLLVVVEAGQHVVVEGNRRLAALKALREPGLLEGTSQRKLERLSRRLTDPDAISRVPATIAPSRRVTDRQIAGRHVGTPVLAWQAENRANFILDKLAESYTTDELRDDLGFSLQDIQQARMTKAITDMARSLDLPEEVKAKLDNPRAKLFTTLERVFESSVGRKYLRVEIDPEHGLRGTTTQKEFLRGFKALVTDIAMGEESSRSLNTKDDIKAYFEKRNPDARPAAKRGSFVPSDITQGACGTSPKPRPEPSRGPRKANKECLTVLPRDLKIRLGNDRLIDIRSELVRLKRDDFPNAGAVLLRVFFELSVVHYLERTGKLAEIVERIEVKEKRKLPFGAPNMKQLAPEIIK